MTAITLPSDPRRVSLRSSRSPTPCRFTSRPWSSSPSCRDCAGASSPRYVAVMSTWTPRSSRVPRKLAVLNGRVEFGSPKSAAGVRVVALPASAVEALKPHLAAFVDDHPDALIFTGAKGRVLRSSSFGKAAGWRGAVASVGLTDLHLHDLRHTGNTLAAVPVYLALVKLALVKKVGGKKQGDRPEA